jgi:Uma2 family endonuclease
MITLRKLTVKDVLAMGEVGLIAPDERIELHEGELYTMSPPSSRHAGLVNRLVEQLGPYRERATVSVQNPLELSEHTLYEPDIALLKRRDDFYQADYPHAEDVFLVIEVGLSSIHDDRERKLPLYAKSGVAEVWLVDVEAQRVEVYREPVREAYRQRLLVYPGECLRPLAFSEGPDIIVL